MITILDRSRSTVTVDDLLILLVAIIWGSSYVVMQIVGAEVAAGAFLMLRFVWALPVILLFALRTLSRLTRDEVLTGAFFGTLLYGILINETIGVQYTSAANAGFLITVSVVLIPLLERIISNRRQLGIVYLATAAALVGCGMLLLSDGIRPRSGDLIILAAAMIRATQITLFGRRSRGARQSLVNVSLIQFTMVCVLAGITSVAMGTPGWEAAGGISIKAWLLIVYLGVLGTSFAFFAQLRAARAASSTRVGLILSTEPVFAALFAVLVAGESLGPLQLAGGALIVVAAAVGRAYEGRADAVPRSPAAVPAGGSRTTEGAA